MKLGDEGVMLSMRAQLGRSADKNPPSPEVEWWSTDASGVTTTQPLPPGQPQPGNDGPGVDTQESEE